MTFARLPFALAAILVATVASAQTPNFAGKWTLVPNPSATPGGFGGGGIGQEAVITQDATSITIKRTTQMGEFTSTYKLDGSESKNTLTVQGNTIDQVSKTKWDGGTLKVDTTLNFDGNPVQVSMSMSLDPSGNLLVESTRPDFQGGGAPITTKSTYKKN
jgi:polyisoprenoid-binding protein YceI